MFSRGKNNAVLVFSFFALFSFFINNVFPRSRFSFVLHSLAAQNNGASDEARAYRHEPATGAHLPSDLSWLSFLIVFDIFESFFIVFACAAARTETHPRQAQRQACSGLVFGPVLALGPFWACVGLVWGVGLGLGLSLAFGVALGLLWACAGV